MTPNRLTFTRVLAVLVVLMGATTHWASAQRDVRDIDGVQKADRAARSAAANRGAAAGTPASRPSGDQPLARVLEGRWTYRSFVNDPDIAKPFNELEFGRG